MNLSFRSKYCHCQSGFWVRAVNSGLKVTSIKTVHNHPCTEGYISVDPSRRQLTSSERLYLRTFLLSNAPTRSLRNTVSWKFHKQLTRDDIAKMSSQLYPERENKRLQKRLDELTVSLETQIQLNSSKIVDEYQRKLDFKEQEFAIFKVEAEEKLGSFESKNIAISKALEMAQSELFRLKTEANATETGRSSELELLMDDLEKSNAKLASAEAELAKLREDHADIPKLPIADISRLQCRIEELEFELSSCSQQKSSLLDQLESLKSLKSSNEKNLENCIQELQTTICQTKASLEVANIKIDNQSDYEEVKRELSLLRSIEFPENVQPNESDNLIQDDISNRAPLEVLILKKNKSLENQLAEANTLREKLQIELTQVQSNEVEANQRIKEQTELIKLLESDLYRLQTNLDESLKLNDSRNRLEGHHLAEVIGDQKPSQYNQSLLNIVQNQRDRFRTRAEELEQNEINLRQQLISLQREVESVRADNVKLYEKIRFLHSYGSPVIQNRQNNLSNQHSSSSVTTSLSPSSCQNHESNDATIIKYSHVYEAQLNPFNQFSRYEKQRVYKKLQPYEKLMLHLGRFVSSDRRLRLGVFLYAIFLHLFIFIALYKAAHFQHSALETEANCHSRFEKHMQEVHNQGGGNL
uniref:Protein CASP n=1 Tax=Schistosoma haematobium TaxID=6185 RepID=A0A095ASM5_SCHHA